MYARVLSRQLQADPFLCSAAIATEEDTTSAVRSETIACEALAHCVRENTCSNRQLHTTLTVLCSPVSHPPPRFNCSSILKENVMLWKSITQRAIICGNQNRLCLQGQQFPNARYKQVCLRSGSGIKYSTPLLSKPGTGPKPGIFLNLGTLIVGIIYIGLVCSDTSSYTSEGFHLTTYRYDVSMYTFRQVNKQSCVHSRRNWKGQRVMEYPRHVPRYPCVGRVAKQRWRNIRLGTYPHAHS